jgi:hypothetical protein
LVKQWIETNGRSKFTFGFFFLEHTEEDAMLIRPHRKSKKHYSSRVGWRRVLDIFTKEGVKASVFAMIFAAVVILFALNEEEPLIQHNLIAVSSEKQYNNTFISSTPYVAIDVSISFCLHKREFLYIKKTPLYKLIGCCSKIG